jgi:hypothetical protein
MVRAGTAWDHAPALRCACCKSFVPDYQAFSTPFGPKCPFCYSGCPHQMTYCNRGVSDEEFEAFRVRLLEGLAGVQQEA